MTSPPKVQLLTERAFERLRRFLHIEAASGGVLLLSAAVALVWSNSPWAHSYHHLWHLDLSIQLGTFAFAKPLHFWINDVLMTLFFLVVGVEIRREMHEGALSSLDQALLPVIAAIGGVAVPALIFLSFNMDASRSRGWAVPTATDIAFAVGVLALLGRSIPSNVRVFLLALAIIDDIIAVLIIALFYSGGLKIAGLGIVALGVFGIFVLQRMAIGAMSAYVLPGAVVWIGFYLSGAHPTLAGVLLGLLTPVRSPPMPHAPIQLLARVKDELSGSAPAAGDAHALERPLRQLRIARRELLTPVVRVQVALHPFVAFGIMPLFALANAGVSLGAMGSAPGTSQILLGIAIALVLGKPLGVIGATWIAVRLGFCRLSTGVSWAGIALIGLLAGIGFTMSIFIAMLAFEDQQLLNAAKLGVLIGSVIAGLLGLAWGFFVYRRAPVAVDDGRSKLH